MRLDSRAVGNAELEKDLCMIHRVIHVQSFHFVHDTSTCLLLCALSLRRRGDKSMYHERNESCAHE